MPLLAMDFRVSTNEDWRDTVRVLVNMGEEDEAPADLTGSTFDMQVRTTPESQKVVLHMTSENGRIDIISPETLGEIAFDVPEPMVETIDPGVYVYDLIWTRPDGRIINLASGTVTFDLGVTR